VYIVSYKRWDSRLTVKTLEKLGVPYMVIVDEPDYENYVRAVGRDKLLILPQKYKDEYDTFWKDGDKTTGAGAARNFAWDHSIKNGFSHHWVMDDNIQYFERLNRNLISRVESGTVLKCMEDFVLRYDNIALAGPNYEKFVKSTDAVPPYVLNTRIYSCLLIRNDIPFRWRGRYNEDTDLSLRVLKDGWVTVQFNAFLQEKVTTQRMKGGNMEQFYDKEGTDKKSKMLVEMHPDVAKITTKFNRIHHHVDYRPFKDNKLKRKTGVDIPEGINNYGMKLIANVDEILNCSECHYRATDKEDYEDHKITHDKYYMNVEQ
tara:strand:+ start:155 stop:1105 length:951 start_codon:yes stop_codon:yes gene_type:complete